MFFEQFTKPIIKKSSNELEKKVQCLKKLKQENPDNEEIAKELKIAQWGLKGENEIEFELKNANLGMYVLRDINFKYEDLTAQIDFVVITRACIYLIECKNLYGNIIVDNQGNFIREYEYNDKKIRKGIESPYRQAERHLEIMKKIWYDRHSKLTTTLYNKTFENDHKILVVMANHENILNIEEAPKEIKDRVIRSDSLVRYLKNDINKTKWDDRYTKKQMGDIAKTILDLNVEKKNNYEKMLNHIKMKNTEKADEIKEKLIEYRKNKAVKRDIPEKYIFTDEELEKILEILPETVEELDENNILSEVKIKFHGQEIIDIINNRS